MYDLCEDDKNVYVISELLSSGNLLQVLNKFTVSKTPFTERNAANLINQILRALTYIHEENLVHRDIKLENIMVELAAGGSAEDMVCKITDFGFACEIQPDTELSLKLGTPLYMAPEVIKD